MNAAATMRAAVVAGALALSCGGKTAEPASTEPPPCPEWFLGRSDGSHAVCEELPDGCIDYLLVPCAEPGTSRVEKRHFPCDPALYSTIVDQTPCQPHDAGGP